MSEIDGQKRRRNVRKRKTDKVGGREGMGELMPCKTFNFMRDECSDGKKRKGGPKKGGPNGGRKGGREGRREGRREGGKERGRAGGRAGGRERERDIRLSQGVQGHRGQKDHPTLPGGTTTAAAAAAAERVENDLQEEEDGRDGRR